jgi:hypothetical protein
MVIASRVKMKDFRQQENWETEGYDIIIIIIIIIITIFNQTIQTPAVYYQVKSMTTNKLSY